jgi:hypothetical protein
MRGIILALALSAGASAAAAQSPPVRLELRPTVGALIQTGAQRDVFKTSTTYGLQAAWEVKPAFHLVGSFAWSPAHHKLPANDDAVNVFLYDVGAEFDLVQPMGVNWELKPFLGVGAGARTYSYHAANFELHTGPAVYGAVGTEIQYRAVALRLEARDFVQRFEYPDRTSTKTRNDIGFSAGLAFHVGG